MTTRLKLWPNRYQLAWKEKTSSTPSAKKDHFFKNKESSAAYIIYSKVI